jgi:putative hydrolase of the HAD superfamily
MDSLRLYFPEKGGNMLDIIGFDADDTLWHNESLYDYIQQRLIKLLSPYADAAKVEASLFQTEMNNLKYYGYGIKSFTLSMVEVAISLSYGKISGSEVQQIVDFGREMLTTPVELVDHVAETIERLAQDYPLMIITKGDLLDQQTKLSKSGLGQYFRYVEVVSHKTVDTYASVLDRYNFQPRRFLMVGNSLRSDVLPVVELGGQAVHIPYHLTWAHEEVHQPEKNGFHQLEHIGELPLLLEQLNRQ